MTPRITPGLLRSVRKGNLLFSEGESRLARVGYGISGFVNCSAIDETDGSGPTCRAMPCDRIRVYPSRVGKRGRAVSCISVMSHSRLPHLRQPRPRPRSGCVRSRPHAPPWIRHDTTRHTQHRVLNAPSDAPAAPTWEEAPRGWRRERPSWTRTRSAVRQRRSVRRCAKCRRPTDRAVW